MAREMCSESVYGPTGDRKEEAEGRGWGGVEWRKIKTSVSVLSRTGRNNTMIHFA